MTPGERTLKWLKANPEKAKANKVRYQERKEASHKEGLKNIKRSKYKTPMPAIKAFCRECPKGSSRKGKNYLNAIVTCREKKCPLYAFRNGNPTRRKLSRKHCSHTFHQEKP